MEENNQNLESNNTKQPSVQLVPDMFRVYHRQFATDRYEYGFTIVRATSKEEALNILNLYLETKPNGAYTSLPCESINNVYEFYVLSS